MYTKISDYWFVFNPNCFVERSWFMYLFTGVKHDFASPVEHVLLTVSERGSSRRALREVGAAQSVVFCNVFCRPLSIISPIFFWLVLSGLWLFCRPLSIISPIFFWLLYCLDFDCFVDHCRSFPPISFDYCIVLTLICSWWLPLWSLQTFRDGSALWVV